MRATTIPVTLALAFCLGLSSLPALAGWDEVNLALEAGDDKRVVAALRPLAEQGIASAQSNLGVMYANGEGVPENDAEAVKWYRLAAEQGYALAQYNLGVMYDNGYGVPENDIKAYLWYSLAAAQGDKSGQKNKNLLAKEMTREQIAQAQAMSARCYESDYKDCD
jgi:TPR repeat protein